MFEEAAKKLIENQGGNAVAALSKTLAFISGHHTKQSKQKSYEDTGYNGGNGDSGYGGGSSYG
jgi:hypothetical protein